jgi:secreted Zn-dependent insulinase-like peptidase
MNTATDKSWKYDGRAGIMSSMLSIIFNQAMAQETYDADLAGLYWGLSLGPSGMKLHCYGFSDRLPDLSVKIIEDFLVGDFLKASYFDSTKDRVICGLQKYFTSRRSDSNAMYYRDALLSSRDEGIDDSLAIAETIELQNLRDHHDQIIQNNDIFLDCLVTGNVSSNTAKEIFSKMALAISNAKERKEEISEARDAMSYIPGEEVC